MKSRKATIALAVGVSVLLVIAIICAAIWGPYLYVQLNADNISWGYARQVPAQEKEKRDALVAQAQTWLGAQEGSEDHHTIVDIYNSHEPLAVGYEVKYDDNWCSTFVSAMAIRMGYTDFIPTECGCQRHIALLEEMGCWVESDGYTPLPGDLIFYSSADDGKGDCTEWSDHIGIVVGTYKGFIRVIEGNYSDAVGYRIIKVNSKGIRGFGTPDYSQGIAP